MAPLHPMSQRRRQAKPNLVASMAIFEAKPFSNTTVGSRSSDLLIGRYEQCRRSNAKKDDGEIDLYPASLTFTRRSDAKNDDNANTLTFTRQDCSSETIANRRTMARRRHISFVVIRFWHSSGSTNSEKYSRI